MTLALANLLTVFAWGAVMAAMTPGLVRLLRGHCARFDPWRALFWFIASSRIGFSVVGLAYAPVPASGGESFARLGVVVLSLLCGLGTLWLTHVYRDV